MSDTVETPEPTRLEPPVGDESGPFWDATRDRELVVQWCDTCDHGIFYPRVMCPTCLGSELSWRPASGNATVYAVSVQYRPANPFMADRVPYAVAIVELDEGVRMMTNVVDCDPESVTVGQSVTVTWEPLSDGRHLPLFTPVD